MTDVRDGRVLLAGGTERGCFLDGGFLRHFAVCDPLHRRYLMLPVIPDDLAALLDQREKEKKAISITSLHLPPRMRMTCPSE